jgi:hypothetical protein
VIAALLTVLSTQALPAFVCTRAGDAGPSLFWESRAVVMHRSGSSSDVDDLLLFRNDGEGDPIDAWMHQLGALAITTVTYETGTGELLDADIEVNDSGFRFSACDPPGCDVRHDLKNTLTHEMGHVLGLDHPPVDGGPDALEATMYASATEGDLQKRDLAADDIAGLCTLFPTGEPAGNCYTQSARTPPPEVRFAPTCGAGWGSCPIASLAALVFLGGRRRRQMRRPRT